MLRPPPHVGLPDTSCEPCTIIVAAETDAHTHTQGQHCDDMTHNLVLSDDKCTHAHCHIVLSNTHDSFLYSLTHTVLLSNVSFFSISYFIVDTFLETWH